MYLGILLSLPHSVPSGTSSLTFSAFFFCFFASFRVVRLVSYKDWREPLTDKAEDIAAAHYLVEGGLGWSLGRSWLLPAWP